MMISDIEMPEMDGYTLTAAIRNDPRMQKMHITLHTSLSGYSTRRWSRKLARMIFSRNSGLMIWRPGSLRGSRQQNNQPGASSPVIHMI